MESISLTSSPFSYQTRIPKDDLRDNSPSNNLSTQYCANDFHRMEKEYVTKSPWPMNILDTRRRVPYAEDSNLIDCAQRIKDFDEDKIKSWMIGTLCIIQYIRLQDHSQKKERDWDGNRKVKIVIFSTLERWLTNVMGDPSLGFVYHYDQHGFVKCEQIFSRYHKVLKINEKFFNNNVEVANACYKIASTYLNNNQYDQSLSCYNTTLRINKSNTLPRSNQQEKRKKHLTKVTDTKNSNNRDNVPDISAFSIDFSMLSPSDFIPYSEKDSNPNSKTTSKLSEIGRCYQELACSKNKRKASNYYEKAHKRGEICFLQNHLEVDNAYNTIPSTSSDDRQNEKALSCYKTACDTNKSLQLEKGKEYPTKATDTENSNKWGIVPDISAFSIDFSMLSFSDFIPYSEDHIDPIQ